LADFPDHFLVPLFDSFQQNQSNFIKYFVVLFDHGVDISLQYGFPSGVLPSAFWAEPLIFFDDVGADAFCSEFMLN
jgi:hypothetical protein